MLQQRNFDRADRHLMSVAAPPGTGFPPACDMDGSGMDGPGLDGPGMDGAAARIGVELKAARLRRNWTVAQAAASLRIREDYLHAIEAGRTAALPGAAYAIGFVRNYATLLRLDADELVPRFRACLLEAPEPALFFPPPARAGLPRGAAIALGLLLAFGAYAGWYRAETDGGTRAAASVAAVPERLAALTAPRLPAPVADAPVADVPVAETPVGDAPVRDVRAGNRPDAPDAQAAPPVSPASAAAPSARIAIRARADCWIQVRDGGTVVAERTLRAGENWSPEPGRPLASLTLTAGNAGGIDLLLDGQPTPPLGGTGMVRRDVSLDPGAIRMAAQVAAQSVVQSAGITNSTPPAGPR